jgi:hypothetical protein
LINRRLKRSISRSVQIIRSSTLRSSHLEKRSKWHLLIGTIFPLDDEHKSLVMAALGLEPGMTRTRDFEPRMTRAGMPFFHNGNALHSMARLSAPAPIPFFLRLAPHGRRRRVLDLGRNLAVVLIVRPRSTGQAASGISSTA